jgi:hypothetical protein
MGPFHRHLWYIKSRPIALYLNCAIGEDADRDSSLTLRLASCLWTNHRLDICPSEEWGEPRVALSLRHHANNERPVFALLQDRFVPELVAATGSGLLGGFTLFQVRSRIPNPISHF